VTIPDVELRDVVKTFGDTAAVRGVSLTIEPGEFIALLGPSGCGKTTTLRMISGLEQETSGEILIQNQPMRGVPAHRRDTAMVFQNFALFPHMTVEQNVAFGLRMLGTPSAERNQRVRDMLTTVDLTELADRRPQQLSGGQRQRVGLARALVTRPSVLLLDEPLGSLDAHLRIIMQAELKELQRHFGITFIHVTHNQHEALAIADRVVVMNDGRIEQVASPDELYSRPRTRFVAEFVGKNNLLTGTVVAAGDGAVDVRTDYGTFRVRDGAPVGSAVAIVVRADLVTDAGGENELTGILSGVESVGSIVTYVLELSAGQSFRLERHGSDALSLASRVGKPVVASWRAEDAILLPVAPDVDVSSVIP
jgi:spermidine/putrescine transport system ATP-binding protein